MLAEVLAWGFIVALYLAAVGVIALPKHWYRFAQCLFSFATLLADAKIIYWATTSSHGLKMRIAWSSASVLVTTGFAIWFILKVQGDINKEETAGAKRNYIIQRLRDFIKEDQEIRRRPRRLGQMSEIADYEGRVEHFLSLHLSDEYVKRFKERGIYALEEMIREVLDGGPIPQPGNDAAEEIRPFYDLLTAEEKRVLRFILPLHRSPTNLNVGQLTALESIQQKTGFVGRNYTTGSYELNEKIIEGLRFLLPLDAGLYGKIICRDVALTLNARDRYYDCYLIFQVKINNDGDPTMVSRFQLDLHWRDVEHPSVRQSVADYYVKIPAQHAGDKEMGFEKRPLTAFPLNEEVINANYKIGFVRFWVAVLPVEAVGDFQRLHKDVTLKLQAFDSEDKPYLIYEGPDEGLSGCGKIERQKKMAQFIDRPQG